MKTWDELEVIKKESLPLWKNPDFIIIYLSSLISGTGDGISKVALLWLSYKLTKSAAIVGMVFICLTLPGIFTGLISGVLADRWSKLKIVVTSRILLGVIAAGYVLAYLYQSIFLVFLSAFLTGTFLSFDGGPFRAYLSEIFPPDKLPKINAAVTSARSLTMLIGPGIGGLILATGNVTTAFVIDAVTFIVSALMIRFLPETLPRMAEGSINAGAIFNDMKRGISYLTGSPLHRFLMIFFVSLIGIYCFSGGLIAPMCEQILAKSNQMADSTALAIIEGTFGLGGFIGSFFISPFMKKFGYLRTLVAGAFLCAVELFAFGCIANIFFLGTITTITAASGPMLMVPLYTFMQEKTEPRFMGRAMGALDTLTLSVISFSYGFGGILADTVGIIHVFIATALVILVFTMMLPFLPLYKTVRSLDK